jgi:hypothetical protein
MKINLQDSNQVIEVFSKSSENMIAAPNFFHNCLSLFQIQNLCQFWPKRGFSQKDTLTAFSFFFPSVLLSCYLFVFSNGVGLVQGNLSPG